MARRKRKILTVEDIPAVPEEDAVAVEEPKEPEELDGTAEIVDAPGRLAPRHDEDETQHYFQEDDGSVQVVEKGAYKNLRKFLDKIPNRSRYSLSIHRILENGKYRHVGPMDIPNEVLETALKKRWGGGRFKWQLCLDGQYAARDELPADMRSVKLADEVEIEGEPLLSDKEQNQGDEKLAGAISELEERNRELNGQMLNMLKEQMTENQKSKDTQAGSMVQLFTVLMTGMQNQQNMAQQLAQQQTNFMLMMMKANEEKTERAGREKEGMFREMMGLLRDSLAGGAGGGEPPGAWSTIAKIAPVGLELLRGIMSNPAAAAVATAPRIPAAVPSLPAPVPAPAPSIDDPVHMPPKERGTLIVQPAPAAPPAAQNLADEVMSRTGFTEADNDYVTQLVGTVWEGFKASAPVDAIAERVANLGDERQFNTLIEQNADWIVNLVARAWTAFKGGNPPAELMSYVQAVHRALTEEVEEEPTEAPAPRPGENEFNRAHPSPLQVTPVAPPVPPAPAPPPVPEGGKSVDIPSP